jgi:hypothetical protein
MEITRTVDEYDNIVYNNENGEFHRTDGPAIERHNGYKAWYKNGKRHREDGPAIIYSNGDGYYYLNGKEYSKEEYEQEILKMRLKRILDL